MGVLPLVAAWHAVRANLVLRVKHCAHHARQKRMPMGLITAHANHGTLVMKQQNICGAVHLQIQASALRCDPVTPRVALR